MHNNTADWDDDDDDDKYIIENDDIRRLYLVTVMYQE